MTPRPRRHLGDPGPQSGPQSTFRGRAPRLLRPSPSGGPSPSGPSRRQWLSRRHWPAAAVGALGAGALVAALAVSGGAGAQPAPAPAATSEPAAAGRAAGPATVDRGVRAKAERLDKPVKIREHGPGTFTRAHVDGPKAGDRGARLLRYAVKVEKGLPYDADETARAIQTTLSDPRSWIGGGDWRLELVSDPARADFTVFLATPGTVDRYCWPLRTYGRVSCQAGNKVMLNAWRWSHGAHAYGADVGAYREYLVNHEVGHRLGHNHLGCPGKGKRAPVMMQQTKGIGACVANPWPSPRRRS